MKVGCKAHFWLRKALDSEEVTIEYRNEHNGHDPNTIKDMTASMLPRQVKRWIEEKVDSGLNWRAIKPMLRISADVLDSVRTLSVLDQSVSE